MEFGARAAFHLNKGGQFSIAVSMHLDRDYIACVETVLLLFDAKLDNKAC